MSVDVKQQIKIRGGHRAYVSKLLKRVSEVNQDDEEQIEMLRISLKGKLSVLQDLDKAILELSEEDRIDLEIEESEKIKDDIHWNLLKLDSLSRALKASSEPPPPTTSPQATGGSTSHSTKLPKLVLKKFSGDPKTWQGWWDSFKVAVHENTIPDVEKFNHLRSLLEGAAYSTIAGLSLTEENYKIAIDLLQERFAQKQIIVNSHMEALLKLNGVSAMADIKKIRHVYDQVEIHVRGLQAQGVDSAQYGTLLIPIMMAKIPEDLRLILSRQFSGENWNLDELLKAFKTELEARERCASSSVGMSSRPTQENPPLPKWKGEEAEGNPTAAALASFNRGITCSYCRKSHPSVHCNVVTDVKARKSLLLKQGRCFICLKKQHIARDCPSTARCFKCQGRNHHASICEQEPIVQPNSRQAGAGGLKIATHGHENTALFIDATTSVLLQTAKIFVSRADEPNHRIEARLIFDTGSQRSYVSTRLRNALQLPTIKQETLMIKTFGSDTGQLQSRDLVQVCVQGLTSETCLYVNAYSVPIICSPLQNQALKFASSTYQHLHGLPLADSISADENGNHVEVDVLIGADYYWHFLTGAIKRGESGPTALQTKVGWVLSGPVQGASDSSITQVNFTNTHALRVEMQSMDENMTENRALERKLSEFWELEAIGISPEEKSVYERFNEDIKFKNGRYEVKLPWKECHAILPDNYSLCQRRLKSLTRRLKSEDVIKEYDTVIQDQVDKGIIERVDNDQTSHAGKTHYLPHHPVIRRDKETTKLRIVYDASAKINGNPSLNDCLYSGPSLLPSIADVLIRFRFHKVALVADIEKAFLMVSISPNDRDALRFIWLDDIHKDNPKEVIYRFCRVVFGVTSSPFLLNATIKQHLQKYADENPELVNALSNSLYVDDLTSGDSTVDRAFDLFVKSKGIMAEGGFNLRKWQSNSSQLRQIIQDCDKFPDHEACYTATKGSFREEDETYTKTTIGMENLADAMCEQKVLGVSWNFLEDFLTFPLKPLAQLASELPPTKRSILKVVAKIFDPLGVISPVTLQMKVLFQELCKQKINWDDPLPSEMKKGWTDWCNELAKIEYMKIPRCYTQGDQQDPVSYQLHGFCDSSQSGYAAVVYLRTKTEAGVQTAFVASKTRVAPLSQLSIPRLELLSALILSRLITTVKGALEPLVAFEEVYCWTDSKTALHWIIGTEKEWKTFVENRVKEIRSLVPPSSWFHCPGVDNPADIPSRGMHVSKLNSSPEWFHGPEWLRSAENKWPSRQSEDEPPAECFQEIKSSTSTNLTVTEASIAATIDCKRYSSLKRLLRVTAYVKRFAHNVSRKERITGPLSTNEIQGAEILWIREMQGTLQLDQLEKQLGLFKDENGIIRCRGRLGNTQASYDTKFPALLSRNHYVTSLIIRQSHESVMHNGLKETLTEVRSKYWIPKGRQTVKKELFRCNICRRFQGQCYPVPESPDLPEFRVRDAPAFSCVGVDFAGPLFVKSSFKENPEMRKVYIALFTCATSRAAHLELVPSLDAPTFLLCLRRFIGRRGLPTLIVSDNAKTFQATEKNLVSLFELPDVQEHLSSKGIKWQYNLAKAPWWGGFFERLVKQVKSCLKKTLGRSKLTFDELATVLVEDEAVLNSRPLTYLYSDDVEEPLTPSHLLIGRRLLTLPVGPLRMDDPDFGDHQTVTKRSRYLADRIQHFRRRWQREYLVDLREFHRPKGKSVNLPPVRIGDVVILHDPKTTQRAFWKIARVVELIKGRDGDVRGARVLALKDAGGKSLLERPLQELYPLEVASNTDSAEQTTTDETRDETVPAKQRRPRRTAAVVAEEKIRLIDHLLN